MTTIDIDHYRTWIGNTEEMTDHVTVTPLAQLAATLDRDDPDPIPGAKVPLLWHWLYFLPRTRQSDLEENGHPKLGGFLPPVPLQRRMWAGSRVEHEQPLRVGEAIHRASEVKDVTLKEGRSGDLVFVLVEHRISGENGLAIREEHDIVYREMPEKGTKVQLVPAEQRPRPGDPAWTWDITPDQAWLFRYSALIFNAHRIHYDYPYVTGEEGYPDLIVHGPLLATCMTELCRRESGDTLISGFRFRALSPVFADAPFTVAAEPSADGHTAKAWVTDALGGTAMSGEVDFAR